MSDFGLRLRATDRTGGGGGGARATLTPSDITFVGYMQLDQSSLPDTQRFTSPTIGLRRTGPGDNDLHFFSHAQFGGVYEHAYTGTPNKTLASAPQCTLVRDWGYPFGTAIRLTVDDGSEAGTFNVRECGLYWDESQNALFKTYSQSYVASDHPCLTATVLNDAAGTATPAGPWRFSGQTASMHRAGLISIPEDFGDDYLSGKRMAGMGSMNSGTSSMPFGPNLHQYNLPNVSTPADSALDTGQRSVTSGTIIESSITHRRPRGTNYATCGWTEVGGVKYDCRNGDGITAGVGTWGGADPGSAENDTASTGCWVQTDDKEGLVMFGFMVDTPPGYTPPGTDPDGLVHMWYGDYTHASTTGSDSVGYQNNYCCHQQPDFRWQTTGPGTNYRDPKLWIFSREQLADAATGAINTYDVYPAATEAVRLATIDATFDPKVESFNEFGAQMTYDAQTKRIFASQYLFDSSHSHGHPVVAVFQVS